MSAPSCCQPLGGGPAALAAPLLPLCPALGEGSAPVAAPHPDAALLALCAEAVAAEAAFSAWLREHDDHLFESADLRAEEGRQGDRLADFECRIADVPAQTPSGLRAKVLAARGLPERAQQRDGGGVILNDVLRLTGGEAGT